MRTLVLAACLAASMSTVACGDDTGGGGGGGAAGSGGAASTDATTSTATGGDSCSGEDLLVSARAYCDVGAVLWGALECPFEPCDEETLGALVQRSEAVDCNCQFIAFYDCEAARITAEESADCSCEGTQVICPDEDLCAAETAAYEACFGG